MFKLISFIFVFAVFSAPIYASDNGYDLLKDCRVALETLNDTKITDDFETGFSAGWCGGIVLGTANSFMALKPALKEDLACIPVSYSNNDGIKAVVNYLEKTPEVLDRDAPLLTAVALMRAYPCK